MQNLFRLVQNDRIVADFRFNAGQLLEGLRIVLADCLVMCYVRMRSELDAIRLVVSVDDLVVFVRFDHVYEGSVQVKECFLTFNRYVVPLLHADVSADVLDALFIAGAIEHGDVMCFAVFLAQVQQHALDTTDAVYVVDKKNVLVSQHCRYPFLPKLAA